MSPDSSQDQNNEEIIELTDIVEDEDVQEEAPAATSPSGSDQESLDEASLEEELSDFFSKLDEGDEEGPAFEPDEEDSPAADVAAVQEEDFDLDDLFEDISEEETAAADTQEEGLEDSWEDIDLDLPGAESEDGEADTTDEFSELDDLFDGLEQEEETEPETAADDNGLEIEFEDESEALSLDEPEERPETGLEPEPDIEATEKTGVPVSPGPDQMDAGLLDSFKQRLDLVEERMESMLQKVEDSLWPRVEEKIDALREELAAAQPQSPDMTPALDELKSEMATRKDLEDMLDGIKKEIRQEIKDTAPSIAAEVIREEIASLAKELDTD